MSEVQTVLSPSQTAEIQRARDGDKEAYARLYLMAGAFLAAYGQLPPELAEFMAERMEKIGRALLGPDTRKALPDAVSPGLKRGRPPKRFDMLAEAAKAANDLYRGDRLKKQVVIDLADNCGFKPSSVKTKSHVVRRSKK